MNFFIKDAGKIENLYCLKIMKMRERMTELIEEMLDGQILLGEAVCEFEKIYIEKALGRNDNHLSRTADCLGIHRNTLSKRVADYAEKIVQKPKPLLKKKAR